MWNVLYMVELPQHHLRKIGLQVSLAPNEAREKSLPCKRADTFVDLIRIPHNNIHLQFIQLLPHRKGKVGTSSWLLSIGY